MHIHILGICGTFMGGLAQIAKSLGHEVTGADANVYPPMSTQLEAAGIGLIQGYAADQLKLAPDLIVVGNAMKRGIEVVEAMLDQGLAYTSGPQWLAEHLLQQRWVLAVAGTHGKTTTASMLAWILEDAGLKPGFLIGGVPENFGQSARLGESPFFVIEADEYDTAFFDKRSKFVHYRPRTLVLNNLEFDHADIFDDLAAIQRQFHHLVRTVPRSGLIISPLQDDNLHEVLEQGCWTPLEYFDSRIEAQWSCRLESADGSRFQVLCAGQPQGEVDWALNGQHNVANALAAIAAARHAGVPPRLAVEALGRFRNVKRRMELRGEVDGVRVYDDFAHHPTAIRTTLEGLRAAQPERRLIAILEPRSNTMRLGSLAAQLPKALELADQLLVYVPDSLNWDARQVFATISNRTELCREVADIVQWVSAEARPGDQILVMSNGGFEGIHQRLLDALAARRG
ncbi:MAG: UDP-N-acetylmuramate:L-alanyl-gamma-D-glutamyl-meso-diaminopimelate ligase [Gammaproteobacteria bacterium]|nr:UDP-N-acetylmuramate:L-alanyl-gamma-D-glutamyl-meso-diaminopimelate ligase [Gammaproteobacteria bacterium]